MPTEIFCGRDCVRQYGGRLKSLGSRALIVTGKSSAANGALPDALAALSANGQTAAVFDRVTPNPTLSCVREGLALLTSFRADFVIGIGGGSPMDAAKAIALLAVEPREDEEIFSGGYGNAALPLAHIPTTAGTGSEVTQYSILTNPFAETKTSISSPALFPRFAFLDGKYTQTLSRESTINTAIDAFSHAVESLLSTKCTPISALFAGECLKRLYPILKKEGGPAGEDRDALLYCSTLAGMAIAQSGTTLVHGMGYSLTYFYKIDHGRANGLLLGETLRLCEAKSVEPLRDILSACNDGVEGICKTLSNLLGPVEPIPPERLEEFARRSFGNKNREKSVYAPTDEEILQIFHRSFL